MRLRDLVANSLPRMRGRKKKSPAPEVVVVPGQRARGSLDRGQLSAPQGGQFGAFVGGAGGGAFVGAEEPDWLYGGVGGARVTSPRGMVTSHSTEGFTHLMLMSRSHNDSRMAVSEYAGSTSSNMAVVADADARPVVLFEPQQQQQQHHHHLQQQQLNCYIHKHNHHHHYHHHHHHHAPPPSSQPPQQQQQQQQQPMMKSQAQNQVTACPHSSFHHQNSKYPQGSRAPNNNNPSSMTRKQEPSFFRKSLASFRRMRRHSTEASKENSAVASQAITTDALRCSVCPYPDTSASADKEKKKEKRPAKPKRKGLKSFSKSKENKSSMLSDRLGRDRVWCSDNEMRVVPMATCDNSGPYHVTMERPRTRERSIESCSSRLYGSRESSCVHDTDYGGFDSASLSGYESDFPLGARVHRSRSRIKTNPWLPSPQPSLSGGRRAESCDLRESKEDLLLQDGLRLVPRSASFEHQRKPLSALPIDLDCDDSPTPQDVSAHFVQRNRSFKPIDALMKAKKRTNVTEAVPRSHKSSKESSKATKTKNSNTGRPSSRTVSSKTMEPEAMNDLNVVLPRSRPNSIISPNSEFVMLTDNLEQLANNISFEYEETLDSTLESVSGIHGDEKASLTELLTDDDVAGEMGGDKSPKIGESVGVDLLNARGGGAGGRVKDTSPAAKVEDDDTPGEGQCGHVMSAYSPDSGVGGLGSNDELTSSPVSNSDATTRSLSEELSRQVLSTSKHSSPHDGSPHCQKPSPQNQPDPAKISRSKSKSQRHQSTAERGHVIRAELCHGSVRKRGLEAGGHQLCNMNIHKELGSERDSVPTQTVCESDIDNTSYLDTLERPGSRSAGSPLLRCRTEEGGGASAEKEGSNGTSSCGAGMMVDEKLDSTFVPPLPPHKQQHLHHHFNAHAQRGPLHAEERPHFPGAGIVMGARMSLHEKSASPSPTQLTRMPRAMTSPCQSSQSQPTTAKMKFSQAAIQPIRTSGSYDVAKAKRTRPSVLNPSGKVGHKHVGGGSVTPLNDMERSGDGGQKERPWSGDFDIPRNITSSEAIESPTENSNCEGSLLLHSPKRRSQESEYPEVGRQISSVFAKLEGAAAAELLMVDLPDRIGPQGFECYRGGQDATACISDPMDVERCETSGGFDASSALSEPMMDASCQTEFPDDCEESPDRFVESSRPVRDSCCSMDHDLDPKESTRLWLLTGNMQGSADTGYSSLARDSRVFSDMFSDEDVATLPPPRWSLGPDQGARGSWSVGTTARSQSCAAKHTHDPSSRPFMLSGESVGQTYPPPDTSKLVRKPARTPEFEDMIVTTDRKGEFKFRKASNTEPQAQPVLKLSSGGGSDTGTKAISSDKVNKMFSHIEKQFQDIFLQIYSQRQCIGEAEGSCARSKHPCESAQPGYHSLPGRDPRYVDITVMKDRLPGLRNSRHLANQMRAKSVPTHRQTQNHTYENVPIRSASFHDTFDATSAPGDARVANPCAAANTLYALLPSHAGPHCKPAGQTDTEDCSYEDIWKAWSHPEVTPHVPAMPRQRRSHSLMAWEHRRASVRDQPHYLEFLKDAPLDGHKRSLFLVPGVGPVDMSCSRQLDDLFSHIPPPPQPSTPPASALSTASSSSSSSASSSSSSSQLTPSSVGAVWRVGGKHPVNSSSPSVSPPHTHSGKKFKLKKGSKRSPKEPSSFSSSPSTTSSSSSSSSSREIQSPASPNRAFIDCTEAFRDPAASSCRTSTSPCPVLSDHNENKIETPHSSFWATFPTKGKSPHFLLEPVSSATHHDLTKPSHFLGTRRSMFDQDSGNATTPHSRDHCSGEMNWTRETKSCFPKQTCNTSSAQDTAERNSQNAAFGDPFAMKPVGSNPRQRRKEPDMPFLRYEFGLEEKPTHGKDKQKVSKTNTACLNTYTSLEKVRRLKTGLEEEQNRSQNKTDQTGKFLCGNCTQPPPSYQRETTNNNSQNSAFECPAMADTKRGFLHLIRPETKPGGDHGSACGEVGIRQLSQLPRARGKSEQNQTRLVDESTTRNTSSGTSETVHAKKKPIIPSGRRLDQTSSSGLDLEDPWSSTSTGGNISLAVCSSSAEASGPSTSYCSRCKKSGAKKCIDNVLNLGSGSGSGSSSSGGGGSSGGSGGSSCQSDGTAVFSVSGSMSESVDTAHSGHERIDDAPAPTPSAEKAQRARAPLPPPSGATSEACGLVSVASCGGQPSSETTSTLSSVSSTFDLDSYNSVTLSSLTNSTISTGSLEEGGEKPVSPHRE